MLWNQLPVEFDYYFKVDSDVTLDMSGSTKFFGIK